MTSLSSRVIAAVALGLAVTAYAADPSTIAQLRCQRRVLLLFVGEGGGPALAHQRAMLATGERAMAARDLTVVIVDGASVTGAADEAAALRRRYRPDGGFIAILIGKDGGEKLREAGPIPPARLIRAIDAMPMRRAGER